MIYNEQTSRGTEDFPIDYHYVDESNPRYIMQHHWHRELEIIRILSGTLTLVLNNKEMTVGENDIVFVNSDIVHGAMPHECVYECIVFDPQKVILNSEFGKHLAEGICDHNFFIFHRIRSEKKELFDSVNKLFDLFSSREKFYELSVIACIYEMFSVICKNELYTDNSEYSSFLEDKNIIKLKRTIAYMRKNYGTSLTLEDIASCAGVSRKYLCSFFRQLTGMTPFEYLNNYRVEMASRALITTDKPITEIAFSCGFNDLSYFIKTFKKCKGITPKSFRNSHYT